MNWNTPANNFPLHPDGSFMAICVDVYDKQEKNNFYGSDRPDGSKDMRETVKVAYIEFLTTEGMIARYKANATFGTPDKPSNLRKLVKGWNAKVTDAHLEKFNPESLLGWPAYITVAHKESKGRMYANVIGAMQPPPGSPVPQLPADYVRYQDRGDAQPAPTSGTNATPSANGEMPQQGEDESSDLPF